MTAAPAPRPAGTRGGTFPEGIQLKVLSGAGLPACYSYAGARTRALELGYTAGNARGFDVFRWGKRKKGYRFLSYRCHIPVRHCLL